MADHLLEIAFIVTLIGCAIPPIMRGLFPPKDHRKHSSVWSKHG